MSRRPAFAAVASLAAALLVGGCTGKSVDPEADSRTTPAGDAAASPAVATPLTRSTGTARGPASASGSASPSQPAKGAVPQRLAVSALTSRLPVPLSRMVTLAMPDGSLELLGGLLNGDHSSNQVRRVALPSGTVSLAGTLAVGVHDSAGVLLNGNPYVYAGGAAHEVATIQQAVAGGVASRVGALPQPRSDLATAVVGGTVVAVGGYDGTRTLADVLVSTDGVHFRVLTQLPVPVRYPAVLVQGQSLLVYGGDVARKPVDAIQRVDLASGKATVVGHLPRTLSHEAAYSLGGASWLVGGTTSAGATAGVWRSVDGTTFAAAGSLPGPRSDAGAAVVGGIGYLVGGETATSRTSTILSLTPAG